ncbi:MAG: DUF354 domain-containing protein [Candidatus Peribacteraceae bacterium]|nr:DUF354 domain-containing protein [Candidatus Peribacteraceae bacterium]
MKIWIDIKNVHEPLFFQSITKSLNQYDFYMTCRDFAEIVGLLDKYNMDYKIIGGRAEGNLIKRKLAFSTRVINLILKVPKFDVSISHFSGWAAYTSKYRRRKHISFTDNDIAHLTNKYVFKHVDFLITPKAIPKNILIDDGMKDSGIFQFDGFKEDIYIADYTPDPNFLDSLPFNDFITIRPESLQATYVPEGVNSIVPDLLKKFSKENINILFLPRYQSDKDYAKKFPNVYMPPKPLNGLDVCYHSKAILTGAGTFSREAAVMGTPAISFYPGEEFLSVDKEMIDRKWVFHSRNSDDIVDYVLNSKSRAFNQDRCKETRKKVISILSEILDSLG